MPRPGTAPLIGRDRELGLLLDAFVAARRGELRSVLLRGPNGAGAGALLRGLRGELGDRALPHRWSATRVHAGDPAYATIAGLLAAAPSASDDPGTDRGLESLLTDLEVVPVEARSAVVGERLARALRPTRELPLVVVVEAVDALDPLARAALTTALRALRPTATLVLATIEGRSPWPADLELALGPLPPEAAQQLAARLAADDADRARMLRELSGDLPGLMTALARWPDPRIPAAERLAAVHPRAAQLTLAAGLAQGWLPDPALAKAAAADQPMLDTLADRGVLRRARPDSRARPHSGGGWTTPSPWLAVAEDALPPHERTAVARRVAGMLEGTAGPARVRAGALARAGALDDAAMAWRQAADQAGADADARASCLAHAVELASAPDVPLVLDAADALLGVGRAEAACERVDHALAALPRRAALQRARLLVRRRRALLQLGRYDEAGRALDEAVALLPAADPATFPAADPSADPAIDPASALAVAEVATLEAMARMIEDPGTSLDRARVASAAAALTDDPAVRASAIGAEALATGLLTGAAAAEPLFADALDRAEQAGERALETRIAANHIFVLWRAGRLAAMDAAIGAELARLERTGLAESAGGQLLVGRAVVLHTLGRWGELTEHLERALAHPERLGAQVELLLRLQTVELAGDLGEVGEARAGLAALTDRPGFPDPEVAYEVMAVRLGLALLGADLARAEVDDLVAEAFAMAETLVGDEFAAARVRVAALRLSGWSSDRAGGPLDGLAAQRSPQPGAAEPGAAEPGDGLPPPAELAALQLEEVAWRTGSGWDRVIEAWDALPMPYRGAWARLSGAHARAAAGDSVGAMALADHARATAEALGAVPLRDAADRLARQLGRRGSRTEGELTARERDVTAQVALGRTNREIARALGMSERTVAVHLTRIFAKLGAGTRGEVTHIARRRGLIDS